MDRILPSEQHSHNLPVCQIPSQNVTKICISPELTADTPVRGQRACIFLPATEGSWKFKEEPDDTALKKQKT